MLQTLEEPVCPLSADARDYQRAVQLLKDGHVQDGAHLLGELTCRTRDDTLRSQCLLNLGEVLDRLGQCEQAYETWYRLAHKPAAARNKFDRLARHHVMRKFEASGLRLTPPDFPPRVQLEITNRCNLRCIMCTRNQMTRATGDMSLEVFQPIVDEVCAESACVLALYFLGEPLINPKLEEMIAYLTPRASAEQTFGIQTNGMLLNEQRARDLLAAGLRNFAFSVDGLAGDLERVRPGATYATVETNILRLTEIGRELGLTDLNVEISKLCDDPEADEVKRFREHWEPYVKAVHLLGIGRVEGNAYLGADGEIHEIGPLSRGRTGYCGAGQRLLVHWNGDYAFCCSDINRGLDLGSVHECGIRECWSSARMQELRTRIRAGDYQELEPCRLCMAGRR